MNRLPLLIPALLIPCLAHAAKVAEVKVLDEQYLMVRILDGEVELFEDMDKISNPFGNNSSGSSALDVVTLYEPALDTAAAQAPGSWKLTSPEDSNYGANGKLVEAVHRKTKLNGMAVREWLGSDFRYDVTFEHWIFLRLPYPMQQDSDYTLEIAPATNADLATQTFTFDIFHSRTEAVRVNLAGYAAAPGVKAADLYQWMGDGGARDYSDFEGNAVYLYNVDTSETHEIGQVSFWTASAQDAGGWNYTQSDVWNVDFTGFDQPGTYRLAVEGVGCSEDFVIQELPRKTPFDVAVQGYFFMRVGQAPVEGIVPVPRQPLYIEGVDPVDTKVYLTSMSPFHPEWETFSSGDSWDTGSKWKPYKLEGSPTNPNARGGHSDALDWDRHLAHVSNIYDILMPYLLSGGLLDDDDTGIAESGNGIPDVIDTARYEVDFFLSLKTADGYGHGLTNPTKENALYQAAPTGIAAWANAANAAMLADAFRLAGNDPLKDHYREAAVTAYEFAAALDDPMLDDSQDIGWMRARGRDFKMTAAAFLYNVTGNPAYEEVVSAESVVSATSANDLSTGDWEQLYASLGYLTTQRPVNYPQLQTNMREAIIREAKAKEAGESAKRPSRRAAYSRPCWFQSAQHVQRTILAHYAATEPDDKSLFRDALLLEADWSLGRNPVNMIQMTTASTPLADKRSVELCYTSGQFDGVSGLHPGHTPYMNVANWWEGMAMSMPRWMTDQGYPEWDNWPHAEGHFNTRHVFANGEFTPRQTMRGKFALYAYLHQLERSESSGAVIIRQWKQDHLFINVKNPEANTPRNVYKSTDLNEWIQVPYDGSTTNRTWVLPFPVIRKGSGFVVCS